MARRSREHDVIRPMSISHSVLSRADGSASFSFGDLTVLASVNGPQEVRVRDELVDRASLEILVRPIRSSSGPREKSIESTLRSLFEPVLRLHRYPRSQIQINVQTTSAPATPPDSLSLAEKAAIVNSVSVALMDAGIEMDALLLAVALVKIDDELGLDPSIDEESKAEQSLCFIGRIAADAIEPVGLEGIGFSDVDELFEMVERGAEAVRAIQSFVRRSVETRYTSESQDKQQPDQVQPSKVEDVDMKGAESDESDITSD